MQDYVAILGPYGQLCICSEELQVKCEFISLER